MKKKFGILALLACMLLCGACDKAEVFTSDAGVTITATEKWQEITDAKELEYLYGEMDGDLEEALQLVLQCNDAFLSMEQYSMAEEIKGHETYLLWLMEKCDSLEEDAMLQWVNTDGMDNLLIEAYREISLKDVLTEEDVAWVTLLNANQTWFDELEQYMGGYELRNQEKVAIMGTNGVLSEYVYYGAQEDLLHFFEASYVKDEMYCTVLLFDNDKSFEKHREEYREIVLSVQEAESVE